jgi:hypothetical protein
MLLTFSLFFDCSGEAASSLYPHTFIIVSGDGYGEILIPKLQNKGKKVIILARQGNENKNLERLANEFYFVNELPKLIETYKLPPKLPEIYLAADSKNPVYLIN